MCRLQVVSDVSGCPAALLTISQGSFLSGRAPLEWQEPTTFDREVPRACQTASGDLFRVFRAAINLRQALLRHSTGADVDAIRRRITFALGAFEEFSLVYDSWLSQCVMSFYLLSDKSKLASGG
jgi:hypothetical protein